MITAYSVIKEIVQSVVGFFKTDSTIITCDRENITCDID